MDFSNYELYIIKERMADALQGNLICSIVGSGFTKKEIKAIKNIETKIHNCLETLTEKDIMLGE